tara:strand:- start:8457 stop:9305 length:849 start_codon:yes stop_codon:yes gene_type:complete
MRLLNNIDYNIIKPRLNFLPRIKTIPAMNDANLVTGFDIGIPLNIFSNIFTNLHYGYDITTPKSILIQFLLGYYTYGKDRYSDALEYIANPYNTTKEELYNYIYDNRDNYNVTLSISFLAIIYILFTSVSDKEQILYNLPFIPLFYLNGEYKSFKPMLQEFKPIYIGIMWCLASLVLPCVLYEHNYDILNYPIDYIPCILTLFATSNLADNKDIEEDINNGIMTIPVKYGIAPSNIISFIALVISSLTLIENPHFENRMFINSVVELQNFAVMGLLYNSTFN